MLSLPKVNGAVGIVLKSLGAMVTGPAKIDGLKEDIAHIKADVDQLQADVSGIKADVGEIKGELHGYIAGHQSR